MREGLAGGIAPYRGAFSHLSACRARLKLGRQGASSRHIPHEAADSVPQSAPAARAGISAAWHHPQFAELNHTEFEAGKFKSLSGQIPPSIFALKRHVCQTCAQNGACPYAPSGGGAGLRSVCASAGRGMRRNMRPAFTDVCRHKAGENPPRSLIESGGNARKLRHFAEFIPPEKRRILPQVKCRPASGKTGEAIS